MQFFQKFPSIKYLTTELVANTSQVISHVVPNMTVKLNLNILNDITGESGAVAFENYVVKDEERPDTVATRMYGAARYAWVIMLANKMKDWYDWPLTEAEFVAYMNNKYESYQGADDGYSRSKTVVYQYIQELSDGRELVVDATAYALLATTAKRTITVYDHEYALNDAKRHIKLVSIESLGEVIRQFEKAVAA